MIHLVFISCEIMLSVCVRTVLSRLMFFKVNLLTHYLKPLYIMHYLSILMHQLCICSMPVTLKCVYWQHVNGFLPDGSVVTVPSFWFL